MNLQGRIYFALSHSGAVVRQMTTPAPRAQVMTPRATSGSSLDRGDQFSSGQWSTSTVTHRCSGATDGFFGAGGANQCSAGFCKFSRRSSLSLKNNFLVEDHRLSKIVAIAEEQFSCSRTIFCSRIIASRRSLLSLKNNFLVEDRRSSKIVAIAQGQFSGRRSSLVEDRRYRSRTIFW